LQKKIESAAYFGDKRERFFKLAVFAIILIKDFFTKIAKLQKPRVALFFLPRVSSRIQHLRVTCAKKDRRRAVSLIKRTAPNNTSGLYRA
jgi:hypothetical protein